MEGLVYLLVFSAMTWCGAAGFDQAPGRTCAVRAASPALFFASMRETSPWTVPSSPGTQMEGISQRDVAKVSSQAATSVTENFETIL